MKMTEVKFQKNYSLLIIVLTCHTKRSSRVLVRSYQIITLKRAKRIDICAENCAIIMEDIKSLKSCTFILNSYTRK